MNQKARKTLNRACDHILNTDSVAPGIYCLCSQETALALQILWRKLEQLNDYML